MSKRNTKSPRRGVKRGKRAPLVLERHDELGIAEFFASVEFRVGKGGVQPRRLPCVGLGAGSRAGCVFCSPAQRTLDAAERRIRSEMAVGAAFGRPQP